MAEEFPGVSPYGRSVIREFNNSRRGAAEPFRVEQIWDEAVRDAGGDGAARDPHVQSVLDAVVEGLNRMTGVEPWGRNTLHRQLVGPLSTRLRLSKLATEDGPVAPVLFVIGPPRTGTTLLQRLLTEDPRARSLRPWETYNPVPAPRLAEYLTDSRIEVQRAQMEMGRRMFPGLNAMHPMDADLPDEDVAILTRSFLAATWYGMLAFDRQFEEWAFSHYEANATAAYQHHRRELAYLQSDFAPTHWVLKAPAHVFGLPGLLAIYPDAWVLNTYREPAEWVSSLCQLKLYFMSTVCRTPPDSLGEQVLRWWGRAFDAAIALRKQHASRFIDIDFRDVTSKPLETIRSIYERTGLKYDEAMERRVSDFLARDQFVEKKTYTNLGLEFFGLTRGAVDERFARYREEFSLAGVAAG